jgi:hypothetical protein
VLESVGVPALMVDVLLGLDDLTRGNIFAKPSTTVQDLTGRAPARCGRGSRSTSRSSHPRLHRATRPRSTRWTAGHRQARGAAAGQPWTTSPPSRSATPVLGPIPIGIGFCFLLVLAAVEMGVRVWVKIRNQLLIYEIARTGLAGTTHDRRVVLLRHVLDHPPTVGRRVDEPEIMPVALDEIDPIAEFRPGEDHTTSPEAARRSGRVPSKRSGLSTWRRVARWATQPDRSFEKPVRTTQPSVSEVLRGPVIAPKATVLEVAPGVHDGLGLLIRWSWFF